MLLDGSSFTFFSKPIFASEEYRSGEGHSCQRLYSVHLNAFYDLQKHTYSDALIQPVHQKMNLLPSALWWIPIWVSPDTKDVFIGDRGFCSYNNMDHVLERGPYFLFRSKDIHSKGLVRNFDLPEEDSFDIRGNVTLVRSHKRKIAVKNGFYRRYVDANATFDYIEHGSMDTYDLLRIVSSYIRRHLGMYCHKSSGR